jgi:ribosomal protein S27E
MKRRKNYVEISKEVLEDLYYTQGLNQREIAERFGVSRKTIGNRMSEYSLFTGEHLDMNIHDKHLSNGSVIYWSRRQDPSVPVKCGACGRERMITVNNTTRQTFDGICRPCTRNEKWEDETLPNGCVIYWSRRDEQRVPIQCAKCRREHLSFATTIRHSKFTGMCKSCAHTGTESSTWKGGRIMKHGYVYVKVYPDHPLYNEMANSMGYIAEHRLVMAENIGRPLKRIEVVHHKTMKKQIIVSKIWSFTLRLKNTDRRYKSVHLIQVMFQPANLKEFYK